MSRELKSFFLLRRPIVFTLGLLVLSSMVSASVLEIRTLNISADIENEKFFSYTINRFEFEDSSLMIEVDPVTKKLKSKQTKLIISTTVPSNFSSGYTIVSNTLKSECERTKGNVLISDFAHYYIDNQELKEHGEIHLDDFMTNKENLWIKKDFYIRFDNIDDSVNLETDHCYGEVVLTAGLEF